MANTEVYRCKQYIYIYVYIIYISYILYICNMLYIHIIYPVILCTFFFESQQHEKGISPLGSLEVWAKKLREVHLARHFPHATSPEILASNNAPFPCPCLARCLAPDLKERPTPLQIA